MTDYLTYWKLDAAVFLRPIMPREIYVSNTLRDGLDRLKLFCTSEPRTLLLVTGDAGTGKSTILRWLANDLPVASHEMLMLSLVRYERESGWLAPRLAHALGASTQDLDGGQALLEFTQRLDELSQEKRHMVIALDSAQFIRTGESLSEILAILNIQSLSVPCLTFVLAGEPSLMETLGQVKGLPGKVALQVRLEPCSLAETKSYMEHRLGLAGLKNPFDDDVIRLIHERSAGVLLGIDIFAEHCLIEACQRAVRLITPDLARAAARHLATPQVFEEAHTGEGSLDTDEESQIPPPPKPNTAEKQASPPANSTPPKNGPVEPAQGSASIRLSTLFKSMPGRTKPKGP